MCDIDLELDKFFGHMFSLRKRVTDYQNWCSEYEKYRDNYIWTTKDGNDIPVKNMDDNHLANVITFIKKKDPEDEWNKVFEQEHTYRDLKNKITVMNNELNYMEEVANKTMFASF